MNKRIITNCGTCSEQQRYCVVTENNSGENSINSSGKIYPNKQHLCSELKGNEGLDLKSVGKNILGLCGRSRGKPSLACLRNWEEMRHADMEIYCDAKKVASRYV